MTTLPGRPSAPKRKLILVLALASLVLGFLCLNYTKAFDYDHHEEWADGHGLLRPSYGIYLAGVILTVLGAGTLGWLLGRSGRSG